MTSPLSTENPTAGELNSNLLARSLRDIPNSLTAQKQKRLLACTFRCCLPLESISPGSIPKISATLSAILFRSYPRRLNS